MNQEETNPLRGGEPPEEGGKEDVELAMLHLRKLFDEFINLKSSMTDAERDTKLYQMLPLYCNVANNASQKKNTNPHGFSPPLSWEGQAAFCHHISQLLAREIKRRALNRSTETASKTIASFLELHNVYGIEESGNGAVLLTAVNLMINTINDSSLQEIMINASLPSTLVRCIYLFLDLPEEKETCSINDTCSDGNVNRQISSFRVFSQILLKLSSHPLTAEELIRVDDLSLLFSTVTAQYGPCNLKWRSLAGDVLDTLARYGLTEAILDYVHAKGCMALCIDNMQRTITSKPFDIVEMLLSICGFLQQSSLCSQKLMDDFRECQGYLFLIDCLLKLNQGIENSDGNDKLYNETMFQKLINMIVSLCYCGYAQVPSLHAMDVSKAQFQMKEFRVSQRSSKAACLRNINAFLVLQTVFLRSENALVCCLILDAIKDICTSDDVNYFVIESQSTLSLFAEKIHQKPRAVQTKFFDLIAFIVLQLNFIPRKELIALSVLLKTNQLLEISIACTRTFLCLLRHNSVFADVYREIGVLEVFATCIRRYKEFLEENMNTENLSSSSDNGTLEQPHKADEQETLGMLVIEALVQLLNGNANNTTIFKNSGGNKCIYDMLKYKFNTPVVMKLVKELVLTVGGEDDMLHLLKSINSLADLHSNTVLMRIRILQILIECLRESHRTRSVFRKVSGFVYVVNVLDLLKNQFGPKQSSDGPSKMHIRLFLVVCQTLSAAMRFEPANAKYFQNEVANTLFLEAIRDMGCFSRNESIGDCCFHQRDPLTVDQSLVDGYANIFKTAMSNMDNESLSDALFPNTSDEILPPLRSVCIIYRILYEIVFDGFDGPQKVEVLQHNKICTDVVSESNHDGALNSIAPSSGLNDYLIVHPSVVLCMLKLLPSIEEQCSQHDNNHPVTWNAFTERAIALQYFLSDIIKSCVRSERNQQIMCDNGLNECIVRYCKEALIDEQHPLHMSLQYIFERLAVQALMPKELRTFLRLGLKFSTENDSYILEDFIPPVPLTRLKTLVSITTPRDFRYQGSFTMPPFIEMDMSTEGFACIFFPNIAPSHMNSEYSSITHHLHSSVTAGLTVNGSGITGNMVLGGASFPAFQNSINRNTSSIGPQIESNVGGGIGSGNRTFPSNNGLTFSTWFCIERYPNGEVADGNTIRLFHILRSDDGSSEESVIVFSISILPSDKSLSVATQEFPFKQEYCNVYKDDFMSRVWCPTFIRENEWHHVGVTVGKTSPRSSQVSIYVDGRHVHSQKINPICSSLSTSARRSNFHAFVGTPPLWRKYSKLIWKQGVCNLIDDTFDASAIARIYMLGPHYIGSFQDVRLEDNEEINPLVAEYRIAFSVNPKAYSYMTLNKIRKVYNRTDAKAIAKQLGMSSHENATPILVMHNAAGHLTGPARTLGGVLVGYLGIRKFNSFPVSMSLNTVGGCSVLLGLVAMSHNIESLYAAVKALTCILRTSKLARQEMNQRRFYQTLAMLYKRKKALLNSHILHLTFNLVGTVHSGHESSTIPNITAFQDLLCDFPIWLDQSNDLIRSLLEHFLELCTESNEKFANIRILQESQCMTKLLHIIEDITDDGAERALYSIVQILLSHQSRSNDLLLFGQYMAKSIPTMESCTEQDTENLTDRHVHLRNRGLKVLHYLFYGANNVINWKFCDEMFRVLGLDWVLLFMQPHLHFTTTVWAFRMLVTMLTRDAILARFREGKCANGDEGYLKHTEIIMQSRNAILLSSKFPSQVVGATGNISSLEDSFILNQASLQSMGFAYLEWLLLHRTNVPEVFSLLVALIIGYPVKSSIMPSKDNNLESIWSFLWSSNTHTSANCTTEKITFCTEAICILLSLTRSIVHCKKPDVNLAEKTPEIADHWLQSHPGEILTLFMSFYKHLPDFAPIVMSGEVITSLIAILFTPSTTFDIDNDISSSVERSPTALINTSSSYTPETIKKNTFENEHIFVKMGIDEEITAHVMNILQTLVIDSLVLVHSAKSPPVIDMVLDFFIMGNHISEHQRKIFLTNIILLLMKNESMVNIAVEGQISAPVSSTFVKFGGQEHVVANVFYVTARFVDKLWQQMLLIDGREIFEYCVCLLKQAKRHGGSTSASAHTVSSIGGSGTNITSASSLDSLYRSLNRCILYLLAYPSPPVNESLVDILQNLMSNRLLVFGAGNHDPDFIGCLTYCILQFYKGENISLSSTAQFDQERTTTWHVKSLLQNENEEYDSRKMSDDEMTVGPSSKLENISFRVWEELYVCKKPVIEEIFKVTLTQPFHNSRAPNMECTHEQIFDSAFKHWLTYVERERHTTSRNPWDVHNSIQSKIQKVTGGLTRLTSRTKLKKEACKRQGLLNEDFGNETNKQILNGKIALVKEFWNFCSTQQGNSYMHNKRYVHQDWLQVEAELIRERGIWGPECCADFTKWTLDSTEGPYRMRKKMLKNLLFYVHYPPPTDQVDVVDTEDHAHQKQPKSRVAVSYDSAKYNKFVRLYQNMFPEQFERDVTGGNGSSRSNTAKKSEYSKTSRIQGDEKGYCIENEEDLSFSLPDNQILLRLLEDKEKVSNIFRTARIQGLDTFEGLMLFGKDCCYIVDGFTLLCNREIHDIDSLPPESFDPILPSTTSANCSLSRNIRQSSKIFYEDIREIHKRRYLLQPIALEIFCGSGQNYLLSFPQKVRNKVFQKVTTMATHIADNAQQSVAGQKRTANVEQNTGLLSSLIGETSVTQRWVRGEISNFQYLMHLNSLAGRSYNDLMQYPVFPWILANYDSAVLDLNEPANFRDLSKPMGAQTKERLEQFLKRYKDWDDPQGDTPPYHYGTHYSSAMIVCSYLIRLEPFTQHFLRLQGGHFDLADRMFHSIKEAWYSASKQNMADVKELIPEFFYLPEFLENSNSFDLGTKQNGEVLNHVVLPPWAKNDPREFIRMHREALECDYVSRHLHLWIDLIFGYKQQGQAAVNAVNVFHHLFYEGNVDIYNIEDPLQKNAAIGFINNFGQIPKQLFRKQHPAKRMTPTKQFSMLVDVSPLIPPQSPIGGTPAINYEKIFFYHLNNLKSSQQPIKELKGPVGQIIQHEKNILSVEQNKMLIPKSYNRYIAWGCADHSLRVGCYDSDRTYHTWENVDNCGDIICCTCPSVKLLIIAGTSSVLSVYNMDAKMKKISLKQTLFGHSDAVTALTSSTAYNIILSGSRDQTAIIWDLARLTYVRQLVGHMGVISAVSINELTGDIATCSGTWLHIWSINGHQLAVVNTSMGSSDRMQQILCVTFSSIREWDTKNVIITGSTDGVVRLWSIEFSSKHSQLSAEDLSKKALNYKTDMKDNNEESLESAEWERKLVFRTELTLHTAYDHKNNVEPASITALAISKDHHTLYVGDARGRIYAWYVAEYPFGNPVRVTSGLAPPKVNKFSSLDH
ncbi:WD repeat and FYVE domain-containing protein 3 [Anopheles maculipalpis]|uniref:WD repeat and FYVE domain-containing protein 3 n=1 Tax=Anopheles maculipalpis TaxID=1496333 RepID=UPI002158F7EB|nr:WD repeat and FYVE domain-containing protein 3 [Anopheles maculipalpis]